MPISNLEPKYLWNQFDNIRKIPRPSKHEGKIREYLVGFAKERKLSSDTDKAGNVIIRIPATKGHEKAPVVVLQAHMDMVCEKNKDVEFDFMKDAIELERDGDWLKAKGTTLGSDNGVGLAAALAMADDDTAVHGPLEVVATVDEETGLTGAAELDGSLISGKTLLNLDTEEIDAVYIGCAGGGDSTLTLPVGTEKSPSGHDAVEIKVLGLRGGHSGVDIHEQRGNAIKALARILWKIRQNHSFKLVRVEGGGVHNAIPREASAVCMVPSAEADAVKRLVDDVAGDITQELTAVDPGFRVEVLAADSPDSVLDDKSCVALINLLLAIPHGVDSMSPDVPGLVETSNNLASVWWRDGNVVIGTSSRSSVGSALEAIRNRIRAAGELAGASVEEGNAYPGWKPNLESKILEVTKKTYENVFGKTPVLKAVHAGLECGIIGEKVPGMDMVSFGPTIEWPHSPDERINIPSVEQFYDLLKAVLKELS